MASDHVKALLFPDVRLWFAGAARKCLAVHCIATSCIQALSESSSFLGVCFCFDQCCTCWQFWLQAPCPNPNSGSKFSIRSAYAPKLKMQDPTKSEMVCDRRWFKVRDLAEHRDGSCEGKKKVGPGWMSQYSQNVLQSKTTVADSFTSLILAKSGASKSRQAANGSQKSECHRKLNKLPKAHSNKQTRL